jgi:aromatic-L-amino-acid decarboxylase
MEANLLDAFRRWMSMPASTRGLITTGGSMATFSAVVSARHRLLGEHLREGVLYTSTQAHHCVTKAAQLAGILPDRHRLIAVDERMRMRVDALEAAIEEDRRAGLRPFLVVSAAGTTNTGAIDPLDAIADLCRARGLWHHCDAAYGGFFHLVPELRATLAGMSRADSLTLDPHKGLFLPYGTGALLVRDGEALREAHAVHAGYLPPRDDDRYDPAQYGPELSRPFRGLRVWLPLVLFGLARFREALLEKHELARWCASELQEDPRFSIVEMPPLSLFAFRFRPDDASTEAEVDTATAQLLERVNARRRVMLTGTTVGERFYGRVCVLCFRTHREHLTVALEDIRSEAG